jgi:hypothetical protein
VSHIPITLGLRAMFIPHNGFSRTMSADDILAECLSNGDSKFEASQRAHWNTSGNYRANRLRKLMGGQAE